MLDAIFLSKVLNRSINVNINASTFPVFYQQQSVQSRQVRMREGGGREVAMERRKGGEGEGKCTFTNTYTVLLTRGLSQRTIHCTTVYTHACRYSK